MPTGTSITANQLENRKILNELKLVQSQTHFLGWAQVQGPLVYQALDCFKILEWYYLSSQKTLVNRITEKPQVKGFFSTKGIIDFNPGKAQALNPAFAIQSSYLRVYDNCQGFNRLDF